MSDFKHLYMEARKGRSSDISSYVEAVNSALDNDPVGYILGLEYIISSDTGLKTLKPFVEKYGLSVAAYDHVTELLEKCVDKCNVQQKDAALYKEAISYVESFKDKYHGAYGMYKFYNEGYNEDYVKTYYGSSRGTQNRLLLNGMISKFNESAIPDLIIVANESGRGASTKLESAIANMDQVADPMFCEWVNTACSGTICSPEVSCNSLTTLVADCLDRNHKIYRESVISGKSDACFEYSQEDIDAIEGLIRFKEFVLTGMKEDNVESIMEAQREIYDLYNELDGLVTESGSAIPIDAVAAGRKQANDEGNVPMTEEDADIVGLLPESSTWLVNTRDKKTGTAPNYIKNNHDMAKWGEEDEPKKKDDEEKSLDDYRRPSAEDDSPSDKKDLLDDISDDKEMTPAEKQQAVQNYYYYTYNNSLNRHSKDDHSVHNRDDHSVHNDDHSVNKTIGTDPKKKDDSDDDEEYHTLESTKPWELNLGFRGNLDYIIEKVGTFYLDGEKYDKNVKSTWFIKSKNNADNCCVSVAGYNRPLRGRSMAIVLKKDGDRWVTMIKKKPNGDHEFPGGGWDKGETPKDAAIRELHEEAQVNIKDVKRIGTSIQFSDKEKDVALWVKHNVDKKDWWYGYYSAVFIGLYDGKFTGKISEEDIEHTFKWQPIDKIKNKINKDLYDSVVEFTKQFESKTESVEFDESVSVEGKKFTKAYRASIDYNTGHLLKITYSLEGCEVTNVGYSKVIREVIGEIAEDYVKENHRGNPRTKQIRAFMAILKGIANHSKRVNERKKFITEFLNKHIGDVGYLDFQAKDCKIIDIYDMYEKKHIKDEIETVGIFAARFTPTASKMIISPEDMKTVRSRVKRPGSRFKVSKIKVGDVEKYPLFMSTYWDDKDDHQLIDINGKPIKDDAEDRKVEGDLDSIQAIIADLEVKGYHIDDKYVDKFLSRYRNRNLGNEEVDTFKEDGNSFEVYDKAAWYDNDADVQKCIIRMRAILEFFDKLNMLTAEGKEILDTGVDAATSIHSRLFTDEANLYLSKYINKLIRYVYKENNVWWIENFWKEFKNSLFGDKYNIPDEIRVKIKGKAGSSEFPFRTRYETYPNTEITCKLLSEALNGNNLDDKYTEDIAVKLQEYIEDSAYELGEEDKLSDDIYANINTFHVFSTVLYVKDNGHIGLGMEFILDDEHGIGIDIDLKSMRVVIGQNPIAFEHASWVGEAGNTNESYAEAVGDADDHKPKSDHPVRDAMMDIDRATAKTQQKVKKGIQTVTNAGRAAMKPINRTKDWIGNMVSNWKDADETNIKEKMADPHARKNLFTAIRTAINTGALLRAGLLLNPIFLFLTVTRVIGKDKREFRIRNEMIGELKMEIEIIDEKIKDADAQKDLKAKYQLMRLKNELQKKLMRVGGEKQWKKMI